MTTVANRTVAEIHYQKQRMPVILPRNREKAWLDKGVLPSDKLAMCVPYPDSLMKRTRVSKRVNTVHRKDRPNNDIGLLLPMNSSAVFLKGAVAEDHLIFFSIVIVAFLRGLNDIRRVTVS